MKKLVFALFVTFSIWSCDVGDDTATHFVISPVQDVTMPTTFKVDSISQIMIRYKRLTDCYIFNGIYYGISENTRTVAIKFARLNESDCIPDDNSIYEVPLDFKPALPGTYVFKFLTGRAEDGTELYTEYEVLVDQ